MPDKRLKDYFPDAAIGDGIFKAISKYKWFEDVIPAQLDTYFYLMCGEKWGMSFLDQFTDENGTITGAGLDRLALMILNLNYNSWEHIYKALTSKYNPIYNTEFTETIKDTTHADLGGKSLTFGKSEITNENVTTGKMEQTNDNKVAGFNSSVNVDKESGTNVTDYGVEDEDPLTVKSTTTNDYGTENGTPVTSKNEGSEDRTYEREYRKAGNIGVTTNMQMIESDVAGWQKMRFYDILIMDICKVIALSIY